MELNRHQASTNVAAYFMGGALAAIGSIALVSPPGFAQLTPDDTLGTMVVENAAVDGIPAILIGGGTQANSNLFHSFQEFNVNTGQRVYFANPIEIQNILTRVTGGNVSNIDGIVGVDGAANLFLLNPNGVFFGPNAQLDVNGSFLTSTANSLFFANGTEFSTISTVSDLLSINVPLGVQFNNSPQGDITNGGNLVVGQGQSLTLFGNTVLSGGRLEAPAGEIQILGNQIELAAIATVDVLDLESGGIGTVSFKADEMNFAAGSVISGTGTLELQPFQTAQSITLGGQLDTGIFSLDLTVTDLAAIRDGFSSITIGRADSTGEIALAGDTTFSDPTALLTGGTIDTTGGTLTGIGNASLTLQAASGINAGAIDTAASGGDIRLISNSPISTNALLNSGGNLEFLTLANVPGTVSGLDGSTFFLAQGDIRLGDYAGVAIKIETPGSLAAGNITVNAPNTTFDDPNLTTLQAGTAITFGSINTGGNLLLTTDNPLLQGRITGDGTLQIQPFSTTLDIALGGTGDVTSAFLSQGEINQIVDGFGSITIGRADSTGAIALAGDTTFRDPTTLLTNGTIDTTLGTLTSNDALILKANTIQVANLAGASIALEGTVTTADNSVFTADEIDFIGKVSGTGNLTLQPASTTQAIVLGGNADGGATTLDLQNSDLLALQDGFSGITIGRADSTGAIALAGDTTFSDPTTLLTGGIIDTTGGTLTGLDDASLNLRADNGINAGAIDTAASGGDIRLISNSPISTNALLNAGGNLEFLTLDDALGTVSGLDSSTFVAQGDIRLGDYSGVAIKIETPGSIEARNITVTAPNTAFTAGGAGSDTDLLATRQAAILRAGVGTMTDITPPQTMDETTSGGSITINSIDTSSETGEGGPVILEAAGDITVLGTEDISPPPVLPEPDLPPPDFFDPEFPPPVVQGIDASSSASSGGSVLLNAGGDITVSGLIDTSSLVGNGGAVTLEAQRNITTTDINTSFSVEGDGGDVALNAGGDITAFGLIDTSGINSGSFDVLAEGDVVLNVFYFGQAFRTGAKAGDVFIQGATVSINGNIDPANLSPGGITGNTTITSTSGDINMSNGVIYGDTDVDLNEATPSRGGDITLNSARDIRLSNYSLESSYGGGGELAGNTSLTANQNGSVLLDGAFLNTSTFGAGDGGNITIDTGIFTATDSEIRARSKIEATGAGGDISIESSEIELVNSSIDAGTSGNATSAQGGNVELTTSGGIQLSEGSVISANTERSGGGGTIEIDAGFLSLMDGSQLSADARGSGTGGDIAITTNGTIQAEDFDAAEEMGTVGFGIFLDNSQISARVSGDGNGEDVSIAINTDSLALRNGGRILTQTSGTGNAGDVVLEVDRAIDIQGTNDQGFNSGIAVSSTAPSSGAGGNILINQGSPRGTLTIANNGYLSALTRSASDAGNIDINVRDLILRSGGQIITNSSSTGEAGSINVTATNEILISGRSVQEAASFSTSPFSGATAPTALTFGIEPDANFAPVLEGASFASKIDENGTGSFAYFSFQVTEAGSSGVFDIDNGETFVDQSSFEPETTSIDTELFLFDQATGELLASNDDSNLSSDGFFALDQGSESFLDSYLEYKFSQPGNYVIGVGQFDSYAADGTLIEGATPQPGQTYDLRVSVQSAANGQIEIPGENPNPNVVDANQRISSGLFAQASAAGAGGDITINGMINEETGEPVRLFQLKNNASVSADATGTGPAGNISINTEKFQIENSSISVSSTAGEAGDLRILANSTDGEGFLLNGSELTAEAGGDNAEGGSIFIEANDPVLTFTDRSLISAKATGADASGGNVTINAPNSFILATPFNDNDILATANDGQGGKINITALRIYGFVPRLAGGTDNDGLRDNDTNDISATSEESSLSGQVIFDVLSVDPVQDLVELADDAVDRSNQIIQACSNSPNTLVVSGQGGLPARPSDTTSADGVEVPWVVDRGGTPTTIADSPTPPELETSPLVEAQAIEIDENGNAYFVAAPEMTDMSQSSGMISGFCGSLQP